MDSFAYIAFIFVGSVLGAGLGVVAHFARAHLSAYPEQVIDGGIGADIANDMMSSHDIVFEKHVVGAEWDDMGFWDGDSLRNLAYYTISGALAPVVLGLVFWSARTTVVAAVCQALTGVGLDSPVCPTVG